MPSFLRLLGVCALLATGIVAAAEPSAARKSELLAFGAEGPDIAGPVLNGPAGTRLSDFKGRVIAVDFWATWCAPCLESMPELNRMRNELQKAGYGDRFEIVSVNVDNDLNRARQFLQAHPVDYPVIGDAMGIAMQRYGPWKLPATFLLGTDGKVRMIWLGYAKYFADDIRKVAVQTLNEKAPPTQPPE